MGMEPLAILSPVFVTVPGAGGASTAREVRDVPFIAKRCCSRGLACFCSLSCSAETQEQEKNWENA